MPSNLIVNSIETDDVRRLIHIIRGKQVILDSDLAKLYGVETKRLNERVKRNPDRFPNEFCFQLTEAEQNNLRSQRATSSKTYGGRRYLPYVFTEAGVAMLSAVLTSETAIEVSIRIMNSFVEMRRFIANNAAMFERISAVELRQLEYQKTTDKKLEKIFTFIENHTETEQKLFFEGQIYDAFSLLAAIIMKAEKNIILIDNYVDISTLNIIAKKKPTVSVTIYTNPKTNLTQCDLERFNNQYPVLTLKHTASFHDRFLILDESEVFLIGASLKDAGRKSFGIITIKDDMFKRRLLNSLDAL